MRTDPKPGPSYKRIKPAIKTRRIAKPYGAKVLSAMMKRLKNASRRT